ncbi:MAG: hypothetical protein KC438_08100, partial [Thermomicrobiales bacterium]|nr:hypothetical protein [Thermomicrobiales bacterium]
GPLSTVNFVTCHDGFTLTDLVSYNQKHNEANGEENRDGSDHNLGFNFGVEGPTDDPEIRDARYRARRNLIGTLLLSHGVPMMLGGDELSNTQEGNNNAYCQDNEIGWLQWELDERAQEFLAFVRHILSIRNSHPALRPVRYVESEHPALHEPGMVTWKDADGSELLPGEWAREDPRLLMVTIDPAPTLTAQERSAVLIMINASNDDAEFHVPKLARNGSTAWTVELDTDQVSGISSVVLHGGRTVTIPSCSILMATA